jgi:hypothetical protein
LNDESLRSGFVPAPDAAKGVCLSRSSAVGPMVEFAA